jgi:probable HAF family extracellular repeat protein
MRIVRAGLFIGLAALTTAMGTPSARAGSYVFTNFDGPPDSSGGTTVNGINNLGQAVGFGTGAGGAFTNFIRNTNGSFTTLTFNGSSAANANGINSSDQIVGMSGTTAFFLTNGGNTVTPLPAVNGTTTAEAAFGINDHGTIVGQYTDSNTGTSPGFVYAAGVFTTLNPVSNAAQVFAQGMNNNGLVVGFYNTDGMHDHGFLYDTATSHYTLLADPIVANLFFTQFLGINDHGEAVGYYQTNDGSQHGFLYDIATKTYTFLDDPNIATSGTQITQITGISNSGEIAGFYVDGTSGRQRGFVATASVPEPGSLVLMGMGVTLAGGFAVRRGRVVRPKS